MKLDRALILARYVLNRVESHELVDAAVQLIVEGEEGMNLAALAGAEQDMHPADARDLFVKAVEELGLELPSVDEATVRVCVTLAASAGRGANPLHVASEIVNLARDLPESMDQRLGLRTLSDAYYTVDHLLDYEGTAYAASVPKLAAAKADLVRALAALAARE